MPGMAVFLVRDRVADRLHEAVDQRGRQVGTGRRLDPPRRQEALLQRLQEAALPVPAVLGGLGLGQRMGDAAVHILDAGFLALGVLLAQHLLADRLGGEAGDVVGGCVVQRVAEGQRAGAAEEQALLHVAAQGGGQLVSMQNWPQPGRPSRSPHCARQSKARCSAAWLVRLGLQPRQRLQVVLQPGRATARRQAGHAGELDHVLVRASASTRLNSGWASHSSVTAKGVPSCTAAAPRPCRRRDVLMAADAAGRDQRHLAFDAGAAQEGQRLRDHVLEVEARVVQVGDPRRAQVAAGQARVFDDDGVGQAPLRSHFLTTSCTPRASDRMGSARPSGGRLARSGRSSGRPAPTTTASMPLPAPASPRGVFADRTHHVDRQQAAALRQLACGADLAAQRLEVGRVDGHALASSPGAGGRCVPSGRGGGGAGRPS
jgi:hypothetical protein